MLISDNKPTKHGHYVLITMFAVSSSQPVLQWVVEMKTRQETLHQYVTHSGEVPLYDLSVFVRPDRFIHAVLQMYSRMTFKDLHSATLTTQVNKYHAVSRLSESKQRKLGHNHSACPNRPDSLGRPTSSCI